MDGIINPLKITETSNMLSIDWNCIIFNFDREGKAVVNNAGTMIKYLAKSEAIE